MTNLVRYSVRVADPDVARVQDGVVVQGRAVGTTTVQVSHEVCVGVVLAVAVHVIYTLYIFICSLGEVVLVAGDFPADFICPG